MSNQVDITKPDEHHMRKYYSKYLDKPYGPTTLITNLGVRKVLKSETTMCPAIERSRIYYCICQLKQLMMLVVVKPRNT